jgi:hypothetical protein
MPTTYSVVYEFTPQFTLKEHQKYSRQNLAARHANCFSLLKEKNMRYPALLLCLATMVSGNAMADQLDQPAPGFFSLESARKVQAEKSVAAASFVPLRQPGNFKPLPPRTIPAAAPATAEVWPQLPANAKPLSHKMTSEEAQQILSLFADAD